jgi:hypothetical protein
VVIVRQPDNHQYTEAVVDIDTAKAWIASDMEDTISDCGDEDDFRAFQALTYEQRLEYVDDVFDKVYEIEARPLLGLETTMDLIKESVSDHHPVPEDT